MQKRLSNSSSISEDHWLNAFFRNEQEPEVNKVRKQRMVLRTMSAPISEERDDEVLPDLKVIKRRGEERRGPDDTIVEIDVTEDRDGRRADKHTNAKGDRCGESNTKSSKRFETYLPDRIDASSKTGTGKRVTEIANNSAKSSTITMTNNAIKTAATDIKDASTAISNTDACSNSSKDAIRPSAANLNSKEVLVEVHDHFVIACRDRNGIKVDRQTQISSQFDLKQNTANQLRDKTTQTDLQIETKDVTHSTVEPQDNDIPGKKELENMESINNTENETYKERDVCQKDTVLASRTVTSAFSEEHTEEQNQNNQTTGVRLQQKRKTLLKLHEMTQNLIETPLCDIRQLYKQMST